MPRNIAIYVDGTGNALDHSSSKNSNVAKLYKKTEGREDDNPPPDVPIKHYWQGVGTGGCDLEGMFRQWQANNPGKLSNVTERVAMFLKEFSMVAKAHDWVSQKEQQMHGLGVEDLIQQTYAYVSKHYRANDSIYLFGFSRGAYVVRSLAGFVNQVGLLFADEVNLQTVRWAYALYVMSEETTQLPLEEFRRWMTEIAGEGELIPLKVHFIGVWDTVGALNHQHQSHHLVNWAPNISHARHALSIHEMRVKFEPVLWIRKAHPEQSLKQVWFAGAHSDVGGGYPKGARSFWSDHALDWMQDEAHALGLRLSDAAKADRNECPLPPIHQENWYGVFSAESVRFILSNPLTYNSAILRTFEVHSSVRRRWFECGHTYQKVDFATGHLSGAKPFSFALEEAENFSVRLHLRCLYGAYGKISGLWWENATCQDIARADQYLKNGISAGQWMTTMRQEKLIYMIRLYVLCSTEANASEAVDKLIQLLRGHQRSTLANQNAQTTLAAWEKALDVIYRALSEPNEWPTSHNDALESGKKELSSLLFQIQLR